MTDLADLFPGFATHWIDTDAGRIFARSHGAGPPLLLLHGFPQSHVMWHRLAPELAKNFAVVAMDMRGYGWSSAPASEGGAGYSKRAMGKDVPQKYMNSPETEIYKKSQVLYNLSRAKHQAMKLDRILLVEGYMDVIGATQAGATEAVATCGTALTVEQIRAMKRHSQNLHLNFDPDSAGAKAAERSIAALLDENMRIRIVELDGGLDPDEYCKEHGAEAYLEKVAKAKAYFYWLADRARGKFDMRDPQGRVDAFKFLIPSIHGLHDQIVVSRSLCEEILES